MTAARSHNYGMVCKCTTSAGVRICCVTDAAGCLLPEGVHSMTYPLHFCLLDQVTSKPDELLSLPVCRSAIFPCRHLGWCESAHSHYHSAWSQSLDLSNKCQQIKIRPSFVTFRELGTWTWFLVSACEGLDGIATFYSATIADVASPTTSHQPPASYPARH